MSQFEGEIDHSLLLRLLESIITIVPEGNAIISQEAVRVNSPDLSKVAMIDLNISQEEFVQYRLESENITAGIHFDKLYNIMKSVSRKTIAISISSDKLIVHTGNLEYSLYLLDPSVCPQFTLPELSFDNTWVVSTRELILSLKAARVVSDYVTLRSQSGRLVIEAGDEEKLISEIASGNLIEGSQSTICSLYSLDYLVNFTKVLKYTDQATISFSNDYPLKIAFQIGSVPVSYYLAPRIE